VFKEVLNH